MTDKWWYQYKLLLTSKFEEEGTSGGGGVGKGGGLALPPPDGVLLELLELKPSVECSAVQCTKREGFTSAKVSFANIFV